MSINDDVLREALKGVKHACMHGLEDKPKSVFPTVWLVSGDQLSIELLVSGDDDVSDDLTPEILSSFGQHLAERGPRPDMVFVSELKSPAGTAESILIHGATSDGKGIVDCFSVSRDEHGRLDATEGEPPNCVDPAPSAAANPAEQIVSAFGVAGRRKSPWLKRWFGR